MRILTTILLSCICFGQWTIELEPFVISSEYEFEGPYVFEMGTHSSATDFLDIGLDIPLPPAPPSGDMVKPFFLCNDPIFDKLLSDYKSSSLDTVYWDFGFSTMGTMEIESVGILWNSDYFPVYGDFHICIMPIAFTGLSKIKSHSHSWLDAVDMREAGIFTMTYEETLLNHFAIRFTNISVDIAESSQPRQCAIKTYPNPFNSTISIDLPNNVDRIDIFNIKGDLIKQFPAHNHISWHPNSSLDSGIYLLKARTQDRTVVISKIIYLK